MNRTEKIIIIVTTVVCLVALIGISAFFVYKSDQKKKQAKNPKSYMDMATFNSYDKNLFGFVSPDASYDTMRELDFHWTRPYPGPFIWGQIEKEKGQYDFSAADEYVKKAQGSGFVIYATIWPYADWDQKTCHDIAPEVYRKQFKQLGDYLQMPCDMEAYKDFTKKLIERYDGDDKDDMEGLKYPVRYWSVDNQPDDDWLANPESYVLVLKATYEASKSVDKESKILNGGISSLTPENLEFWKKVLGEGSAYLDICAINAPEDFNIEPLISFMKSLKNEKPIWLSSVQFGHIADTATEKRMTEEEWAYTMVKDYVSALGMGVKRIYYSGIDNKSSSTEAALVTNCKKDPNYCESCSQTPEDNSKCPKQKMFDAFKTISKKLSNYDSMVKIADGQYRFYHGDKSTFVIWKGRIPSSLVEKIKITDVFGTEYERNASDLTNFNAPLYIEDQKDW